MQPKGPLMTLSSILPAFLALAVVLGLIWLAQHAARLGLPRLQRHAPQRSGRLDRVASLVLDPRRRVHLLACDGRVVAVLTGGPQDVVLGWLPPADGTGHDEPAPKGLDHPARQGRDDPARQRRDP